MGGECKVDEFWIWKKIEKLKISRARRIRIDFNQIHKHIYYQLRAPLSEVSSNCEAPDAVRARRETFLISKLLKMRLEIPISIHSDAKTCRDSPVPELCNQERFRRLGKREFVQLLKAQLVRPK